MSAGTYARKPGYKKIKSALEDFVLQRCSIWNVNKVEVKILLNWSDIVGHGIADIARPEKVTFTSGNSGTLFLRVKNGGHAMFLQYAIPGIIEKISVHFGFKAVGAIKIVQ